MNDIFKDYTLKEDGSWYEFYLETKDEDGKFLPDLESIEAYKSKIDTDAKISMYKQYLEDTDYKVLSDYDKDVDDIVKERQVAREFIRDNR